MKLAFAGQVLKALDLHANARLQSIGADLLLSDATVADLLQQGCKNRFEVHLDKTRFWIWRHLEEKGEGFRV